MINRDDLGRLRRLAGLVLVGLLLLALPRWTQAPVAGADGWSRLHLPLILRRARAWPVTPTRTPTRTRTSVSPPPPTLTFTPTNTGTPQATATPTATATSDGCAWFEAFSSSALDAAWSWVRQDPTHWSLTARPGYLRISTGPGELVGNAGVPSNLLLRAASGDWEIVTRVLFDPQENVQQAALVAYQDDDHFVAVQRMHYYGDLVGLFAESEAGPFSAVVETELDAILLKLAKTGTVYTGSFSADGVVWFPIGAASDVALSNIGVGLGAWNGPAAEGASSIAADFDWFCFDQ